MVLGLFCSVERGSGRASLALPDLLFYLQDPQMLYLMGRPYMINPYRVTLAAHRSLFAVHRLPFALVSD